MTNFKKEYISDLVLTNDYKYYVANEEIIENNNIYTLYLSNNKIECETAHCFILNGKKIVVNFNVQEKVLPCWTSLTSAGSSILIYLT